VPTTTPYRVRPDVLTPRPVVQVRSAKRHQVTLRLRPLPSSGEGPQAMAARVTPYLASRFRACYRFEELVMAEAATL